MDLMRRCFCVPRSRDQPGESAPEDCILRRYQRTQLESMTIRLVEVYRPPLPR
jgi:hypothetical protein